MPDSDIIYLDAMGSSFVVLNSLDTADELLDKRSTIYSGRYVPNVLIAFMSHGVLGYIYPCSTACEWISILMDSESLNSFRMGWGWLLVHLPYGDAWRAQRRLYHQELSVKATQQRYPLHIQASHVLLDRLHATPERWQKHLIQYVLTFSFVFR